MYKEQVKPQHSIWSPAVSRLVSALSIIEINSLFNQDGQRAGRLKISRRHARADPTLDRLEDIVDTSL